MSPTSVAQQIDPTRHFRRYVLSLCLAIGIIVAWGVSAALLNQPLFTAQKSRLLLEIGAANGQLFVTHEWWRLLTSQFLHVHFLHMLFNAMCILILGGLLEEKYCWWRSYVIYFVGGTIGQLAVSLRTQRS
jgi:rhomboid protease GluP